MHRCTLILSLNSYMQPTYVYIATCLFPQNYDWRRINAERQREKTRNARKKKNKAKG